MGREIRGLQHSLNRLENRDKGIQLCLIRGVPRLKIPLKKQQGTKRCSGGYGL